MILAEVVEGVADCLHALGYDAHESPPMQHTPPSAVIELPETITYHTRMARREQVELVVTVVVSRADAKDAWYRLYAALSTQPTPNIDTVPIVAALEGWPGPWKSLTVTTADNMGTIPLSSSSNANGLAAQFHCVLELIPSTTIPEESS